VADYLRQWIETAIVRQDAARRALARLWKGGLRCCLRWNELRGATGALDVLRLAHVPVARSPGRIQGT